MRARNLTYDDLRPWRRFNGRVSRAGSRQGKLRLEGIVLEARVVDDEMNKERMVGEFQGKNFWRREVSLVRTQPSCEYCRGDRDETSRPLSVSNAFRLCHCLFKPTTRQQSILNTSLLGKYSHLQALQFSRIFPYYRREYPCQGSQGLAPPPAAVDRGVADELVAR